MNWLVAYDVADDRVRERLAKLLEGRGHRVQESVFECRLPTEALPELVEALGATLGAPEVGQVRVYRLCADCLSASVGIGAPAHSSPACYVVE